MSLKGKKILITGGAGFIGTSLVKRVIGDNKVVVCDNLHRNAIKYADVLNHPNMQFVECDVMDAEKVRESMKGL